MLCSFLPLSCRPMQGWISSSTTEAISLRGGGKCIFQGESCRENRSVIWLPPQTISTNKALLVVKVLFFYFICLTSTISSLTKLGLGKALWYYTSQRPTAVCWNKLCLNNLSYFIHSFLLTLVTNVKSPIL